jgi:hypothetical protein
MAAGAGGLEYEEKVLSAIKTRISDTPYRIKPSTAGFSAAEVDLILLYKTHQIAVEIKQDKKAQMGGGSYNCDRATGKFRLSAKTTIDPGINETLLSELDARRASLNTLLDFAKENSPVALGSNISGLPLRTTKAVWEEMTKKRLLVPLNAKVEAPTSFLYNHYKKKGCYYIQIGGLGLFYLHSNPLNLPVPQLRAAMQIELRMARAGSKMDQKLKVPVASGNIRAQGRLNAKSAIKSPYSLDNPADFITVFGDVKEADIIALSRK